MTNAGTLRLVTTSGQHGREITRLMHAAEDWLRANPDLTQTLTLGVETTNTSAIALYRKLGYAIATTFPGPSGNPCYAMSKRLE